MRTKKRKRPRTVINALRLAIAAVLESRLADILTAITPVVRKSIGVVKVQPFGDATFHIKVTDNSVKGGRVISYRVNIQATRLS